MARTSALSLAAALTAALLASSALGATIRYGSDASTFDPGNAATYTEVAGATWADVNTALASAQNATTRGFVYVSGDISGSGATTGALLINGTTGSAGFEFKGGFNAGFTAQDYDAKSVLNASASSGSKSRVLVIGASYVQVDGFRVTGGYTAGGAEGPLTTSAAGGAGIVAQAVGLHLSHLEVDGNTTAGGWKSGGGIALYVAGAALTRLEYLDIHGNTINGGNNAQVYGGGIYATGVTTGGNGGATDAPMIIANTKITGNTSTATGNYHGQGSGAYFQGPERASNGSSHWTFFGLQVTDNNLTDSSSGWATDGQNISGVKYGEADVINCTLADNRPVSTGNQGGTHDWGRGNVYVNNVLAGNGADYVGAPNDGIRFTGNLIADNSTWGSASAGTFFTGLESAGTSGFRDGGSNQQVSDPLFVDPTGGDADLTNDYLLQGGSAGAHAGLIGYDASGLGFAYIDANRNGSYTAGIDVIVDIKSGGGQYTPGAGEFYYPTDLNGNPWVVNADAYGPSVAPQINIGAFADATTIPEPATMALLAVGGLAMIGGSAVRRRRRA